LGGRAKFDRRIAGGKLCEALDKSEIPVPGSSVAFAIFPVKWSSRLTEGSYVVVGRKDT
jgi:hypothetical protein